MIAKFARKIDSRTFLVRNLKGEVVIISRGCRVCGREDRAEIDDSLASSTPVEEISKQYRIELEELLRHREEHLLETGNRGMIDKFFRRRFARYIDLQEELLRLIDRLNDLFRLLERFDEGYVEGLRTRPTPRDYIASINERRRIIEEIRRTLETISKLKAEVKTEKDLTDLLRSLREK